MNIPHNKWLKPININYYIFMNSKLNQIFDIKISKI
jgi:hypothetical protein